MRRFAKVAKIWGIVKQILFNIIYIIIHKEKRVAKERTGVGIVQIEKT